MKIPNSFIILRGSILIVELSSIKIQLNIFSMMYHLIKIGRLWSFDPSNRFSSLKDIFMVHTSCGKFR